MTIYKIKKLSAATSPYFFSTKTLKFFGQTMKDFKTRRQQDGRYIISAPMKDSNGKNMGTTIRYFNPSNNDLETI